MRAQLSAKRIWFDTIGSSSADEPDQGERPTILALHGAPPGSGSKGRSIFAATRSTSTHS